MVIDSKQMEILHCAADVAVAGSGGGDSACHLRAQALGWRSPLVAQQPAQRQPSHQLEPLQ